MKLLSEPMNIQRFGGGIEKKITMKIGPKAFKVLSDHLYSRKIEAIVREYACNAWDSHIAAGKSDVPFEIHLPSALEPWFSIKDFGIGLSLAGVESGMTYFESLKENTNELTGTFGLGMKAGFSYAKTFTIETRWKKEKWIVTCFINDDKEPATKCLNIEPIPTDECDGLEIKIAVKDEDIRAFKDSAQRVLRYFPLKPIITHGGPIDYPAPDVIMRGNGWRILKNLNFTQKIIALQGNVAYPLSPSDVDLAGFEPFHMEVDFPIGEICPSPNRETLSYDKSTVANIDIRMGSIRKELYQKIQSKISKESSLWNASVAATQMLHDLGIYGDHFTSIFNNLRFKKTKLPSLCSIESFEQKYCISQYETSYRSGKFRLTTKYHKITNFMVSGKNRICYNDGAGRISARLNKKYEKSKVSSIFVFSPIDEAGSALDDQKDISDSLFGVNVELLSCLTLPKRSYIRSKNTNKKNVRMIHDNGRYTSREAEIDLAKGGFFVRLERSKYTLCPPFWSDRVLDDSINAFDTLDIIKKDTLVIYGFSRAREEKLSKKYPGKWTNFADYASMKAFDTFNSGIFDKDLGAMSIVDTYSFDLGLFIKQFAGQIFPAPKDFQEFYDLLSKAKTIMDSDRIKCIRNLSKTFNITYTSTQNSQWDCIQKIFDKYPLIDILLSTLSNYEQHHNNKVIRNVLQYVKDLDDLESFRITTRDRQKDAA